MPKKFHKKKSTEVNVKTDKGNFRWKKGNAALSNPTSLKFRNKARAIWQNKNEAYNLEDSNELKFGGKSAKNRKTTGTDLLKLHNLIDNNMSENFQSLDDEAQNQYAASLIDDPLANIFGKVGLSDPNNFDKDEMGSLGSTMKSNISGISDCTNNTFVKLQAAFSSNNKRHIHAYALFSAITDNIRNLGGDENNNAYYLQQLIDLLKKYSDSIEAAKMNNNNSENPDEYQYLAGGIYLLNLTLTSLIAPDTNNTSSINLIKIKAVDLSKILINILKLFNDCDGMGLKPLLRTVNCLAIVNKYNLQVDAIKYLTDLALKSNKAKIRKSICVALYQGVGKNQQAENENQALVKDAVRFVTENCVAMINANGTTKASLAAFQALKAIFNKIDGNSIKTILEIFLSFVLANNADPDVKLICMSQVYNIFKNQPKNVSAEYFKIFLEQLVKKENLPSIDDQKLVTGWVAMTTEVFVVFYSQYKDESLEFLNPLVNQCVSIMVSQSPNISKFGAQVVRHNIIYCCLLSNAPSAANPRTIEVLNEMFKTVAQTLTQSYRHIWNQTLIIISKFFQIYKAMGSNDNLWKILKNYLPVLEQFYNSPNFAYPFELNRCFENIISNVGPRKFLEEFPLKLTGKESLDVYKNNSENSVNSPLYRSWLFPVMKKAIAFNADLNFFFEYFKPISITLYKRMDKDMNLTNTMKTVFNNLFLQIWELFPAFCKRTNDLSEHNNNFSKDHASQIYQILELKNLNRIWKSVISGLHMLAKHKDSGNFGKTFAPRFSKKLLNIYMELDQMGPILECNKQELAKILLDTIQGFANVVDRNVLAGQFQTCMQIISDPKHANNLELQANILDIVIRLSSSLPLEIKEQVYAERISVWISNEEIDATIQKKAYRCLEAMIDSDEFLIKHEDDLIKEFTKNFGNCNSGSKKSRLKILYSMISKTKTINSYGPFIPEIVVSYNEKNKEAREFAKKLIKLIASHELIKKDSANQKTLVDTVMTGFEGDPSIIAKTIEVLTDIIDIWRNFIDENLLKNILDKAMILMQVDSKEVLRAVVCQFHLILTILHRNKYIVFIKPILERLAALKPTTIAHFRKFVKSYLQRLVKIFGYQEILSILPERDEQNHISSNESDKDNKNLSGNVILHKMMQNIKKVERTKENRAGSNQHILKQEADDNEVADNQRKPQEMADILEYSSDESEDEDGMNNSSSGKVKKAHKTAKIESSNKQRGVIEESADQIIDFNDPMASKFILSKRPETKTRKEFKPDKFVREQEDGRIVVSMHDDELGDNKPHNNQPFINSDSEAEDADDFADFFNSDDDLPANATGGTGIFRDIQTSQKDKEKKESQLKSELDTSAGAKFKNKKGKNKHDVKKGDVDPYAYTKLSSGINNKRKRKQIQRKFKKDIKVLFNSKQGNRQKM